MAKKTKEKELDMSAIENQKIVDVELNSQMKSSYIDYAMSVIVSRALPDVRDGLKPVHRRILYDMYEANLLYENDFRKSAATVGDVLGKYHPHGDSSVYDAMVRLAQDFSLRYPLVCGKGNFGSVDGDPPAAYRYTEAKMAKISSLMLSDIEKETVDYVSNYDDATAQWDDNTLTIGVTNKEYADDAAFLADINAAVAAAAGGNEKKLFTFDTGSFVGASTMTPGQRKELFGSNPSLSFGDGEDSFYTTVAKSLSTFNLTDGRKGAEQSYKDLENVTVQQDGTIIGYHAVHGYMNLGRIDIATFDNPNGLTAMGGTLFAESVASGQPKLAVAGQDGAGEVVSGALEMSNVDLAQEFTDMITTQRGFQANSRIITVSDTLLEELTNLKR